MPANAAIGSVTRVRADAAAERVALGLRPRTSDTASSPLPKEAVDAVLLADDLRTMASSMS
jgi:hypothetical protein